MASLEIKRGDPYERVWFLQARDLWEGSGGGAGQHTWRQHMLKIDKYVAASNAERGYFPSLYCSEHKLIPLLLATAFLCIVCLTIGRK